MIALTELKRMRPHTPNGQITKEAGPRTPTSLTVGESVPQLSVDTVNNVNGAQVSAVPIFPSIDIAAPFSNGIESQAIFEEAAREPYLEISVLNNFLGEDQGLVEQAYYNLLPVVNEFLRRARCPFSMREDLAQEAMFSIWINGSSFDQQRGDLSGWIRSICKNRVADYWRMKGRRPNELDLDNHQMDDVWNFVETRMPDEANVESQVIKSDLLFRTIDIINSLPSGQRGAIGLALVHNLTQKEIAERTGKPLGTIKTRIYDAQTRIRQELAALE